MYPHVTCDSFYHSLSLATAQFGLTRSAFTCRPKASENGKPRCRQLTSNRDKSSQLEFDTFMLRSLFCSLYVHINLENVAMSEPHEIKLVLKWREMWKGKKNDFVASLPNVEERIGRIYLLENGPQANAWFSSFTAADVSRNIDATSGVEPASASQR